MKRNIFYILLTLTILFILFSIKRKKSAISNNYFDLFKDYSKKPKTPKPTIVIFDYKFFTEFKKVDNVYQNNNLKFLIMDLLSQDCMVQQIFLNVLPEISKDDNIQSFLDEYKKIWKNVDEFFKFTLTPQVSGLINTTIFKQRTDGVVVIKIDFTRKSKLFTFSNQLCKIISDPKTLYSFPVLKFQNNDLQLEKLYNL